MLVQYLVGICCLRRNPGAVEVMLGNMVLDPAAQKERDVDVTVTLEEGEGVVRAFKAYEVKREKTPLDVSDIEQLCIKLNDMPSVTHRAVVSASGFTDAARTKAAHHGVELFAILPWTKPMEEQFPGFGMRGLPENCIKFSRTLLYWQQHGLQLVVPGGPKAFTVEPTEPILTADEARHPTFPTYGAFRDALLLRSTEILSKIDPAVTVLRTFLEESPSAEDLPSTRPEWPHTHTLDIACHGAHLVLSGRCLRIDTVTITGFLQWQTKNERPLYHVMERVSDGEAFAGAMVALGSREGEMFGFIVPPDSKTAGVHIIQLEEKHLNAIRQLRIDLPPASEP